MRLYEKQSGALKAVDGLVFKIEASAGEGSNAIVGKTINAKTQTIDVQTNPFDDFFFGDPFGFFGNPNQGQGGTRKQKVQTPKKEATGLWYRKSEITFPRYDATGSI